MALNLVCNFIARAGTVCLLHTHATQLIAPGTLGMGLWKNEWTRGSTVPVDSLVVNRSSTNAIRESFAEASMKNTWKGIAAWNTLRPHID